MILDGRNRYRACTELGIRPPFEDFTGTEEEAAAAVDSWNLHRRHLTREQKREVIAFKLRENPERSNRDIAAEVKTSPMTVIAVRKELAASGVQPGHLATTPDPAPPSTPAPAAPPSPPPPPTPPPAPPKVTGRDGKQYPAARPEVKPASKPQRSYAHDHRLVMLKPTTRGGTA